VLPDFVSKVRASATCIVFSIGATAEGED